MPRLPRQKSKTHIYHIMARGVNKEEIFLTEEDFTQFIYILKKLHEELVFAIYGFCLMNNHFHLLVYMEGDVLSLVMKRLGIRYAWYFNNKHGRVGHLFQDRFSSEKVETEEYLHRVLRYIHQNPLKANLVKDITDYKWSSYRAYLNKSSLFSTLVDTEFILKMYGTEKAESVSKFCQFMEAENEDSCLDEQRKLSDEELKEEIMKILGPIPFNRLHSLNIRDRNNVLQRVKAIKGVSIRQIAKVTGFGKGIIQRL